MATSELKPSLTRYMQVANALHEEITSGRLAVGGVLPSEHELSARFAVSRHTVREALRHLQQAGLVQTQGGGRATKILAAGPRQDYRYSASSIEEIIGLSRATRRELKERGLIRVDAALSAEIHCAAGQEMLVVASRRWFIDAPRDEVAFSTIVYVPAAYASIRRKLKTVNSVVEGVVEQFGVEIAEIEHRVDAVAVDADQAAQLGVEPGSPGLKTIRRYLDRTGGVIVVSVSIAPAGRAGLTMVLRRAV